MSGRIICGDSRYAIPQETVQLVVTSPPYNVGIDYADHDDGMPFGEWQRLIGQVFRESWRVLEPGGRMAVNIVHGDGRSPMIPLGHEVEKALGVLPRAYYMGAIVWDKSAAVGPSTAWGSWKSPSAPVLRGEYEMIYVFGKGGGKLMGQKLNSGELSELSDITGPEFIAATKDVWRDIGTTNADRSGHPAAFPVALAQRLIQLYTWPGMKVLDPFFGSGTTGLAADSTNRDWTGVELSMDYCKLAAKRIAPFQGMEPEIEVYEDDEGLFA